MNRNAAQTGGFIFFETNLTFVVFCVIPHMVKTNKGAKMIATNEVGKREENEGNKKESPKSSNGLAYVLGIFCIIVAIESGQRNKRLSEIRDAINFQNLLILNLMGSDVELPADTMLYRDANRLYVQSVQEKPKFLSPIAYGK